MLPAPADFHRKRRSIVRTNRRLNSRITHPSRRNPLSYTNQYGYMNALLQTSGA